MVRMLIRTESSEENSQALKAVTELFESPLMKYGITGGTIY